MKKTDLRSALVLQIYIYRLRSFSSSCLQGDEGNVTPQPFRHGTPLRSLLVRRYKYKSHLSEQPRDPSLPAWGRAEGENTVILVLCQTAQATLSAWALPVSVVWRLIILLVRGQMMSLSSSLIGHRLVILLSMEMWTVFVLHCEFPLLSIKNSKPILKKYRTVCFVCLCVCLFKIEYVTNFMNYKISYSLHLQLFIQDLSACCS